MDTVWQDVRLALRLVRRSPGFAAIIVFTLALGIGANAAIFGVVNGLLLRPLPVADPHRLVTISSDAAIARGFPAGFGWTFAMWKELQPHVDLFDGTLAWTPARFDLAPSGERQLVEGLFASGGYFATLGVPAVLGRTFTAADDRPGGGAEGPVAVISYGLWQRRFGGAAGVIGGPLVVDGVTVTIVGVTPPEFFGADVGRAFDVALPLETEPLIRGNRSSLRMSRLLVMLRLKPGQSTEAGTATLRNLQPAILGVTPENMSTVKPPHNREPFTLVSAAAGTSLPVRGPSGLRQSYARPLVTILVVVLLVLLIACVNIANLLLARGTARRHELSVRIALGAPRARLARQLLIESLVFAALGAIGALLDRRVGQSGSRCTAVDAGRSHHAGSVARLADPGVHRGRRARNCRHLRYGTGVPRDARRFDRRAQKARTRSVAARDRWHDVSPHSPAASSSSRSRCRWRSSSSRRSSCARSNGSRTCLWGSIPIACWS